MMSLHSIIEASFFEHHLVKLFADSDYFLLKKKKLKTNVVELPPLCC